MYFLRVSTLPFICLFVFKLRGENLLDCRLVFKNIDLFYVFASCRLLIWF